MIARSGGIPRSWSFRPEKLGQDAIRMIGNLFFAIFVLGVIVFTIIVATYQPEDPLLHPSAKITNFLTSNSNATFKSDRSEVRTGEDFIAPTTESISSVPFINVTDVDSVVAGEEGVNEKVIKEVDACDVDKVEGSFDNGIGDVSLVQTKLPKKVKRKRPIKMEDGTPVEYEEYIDYIFPDEVAMDPNRKLLEAAYKWKRQKISTDE